jgi:FtsP/CotA-like multicopper oxidase with cupredoxin domain
MRTVHDDGQLLGHRSRYWMSVGASLLCVVYSHSAWSDKAGCEYKPIEEVHGTDLKNPPEINSQDGVLDTRLVVKFTDPKHTSIAGCAVHLRTYNGELVGPTLRAKPGDTLRIVLDNQLIAERPEQIQTQIERESSRARLGAFSGEFNVTNLHTHGLHVSPSGNSDNVLLNIAPKTAFPYEIKIPSSHPSGTFWYHAHSHGSTSIQVGSGMAGALILEDDAARTPTALRDANKNEKILMLQTILYDQNGELEQIAALVPSPKDLGGCSIPGNKDTWLCSHRRVTINGQITPRIVMRPGEVQRWRIVDTAFRQSFVLKLDGHQFHEIALDGLYLGYIDTWQQIELQPGYRSDVLVQASRTPGIYRLMNLAPPAFRAYSNVSQQEQLIAFVVVEGEPLDMALPTNAEMSVLAPFPGVDLRQSYGDVQEVVFKLGSDRTHQKIDFQVNYQAFDHDRTRKVVLNTADLWSLTTVGDPRDGIPPQPHVFHIHVNPFQVLRKDPAGADKLVWRDTVLVPRGQRVDIYTRYLDYVGKFVVHCHFLDHEDLGMMEIVEVVEPVASSSPQMPMKKH